MTIRVLSDAAAAEKPGLLSEIEDIFFLSSVSGGLYLGPERDAFLRRWTGYYLYQAADHWSLYERDGRLRGYLTGCIDSRVATPLYDAISYYSAFEDFYDAYPAHFHINVHPDARGQGIGAELVEEYLRRVAGVHVVTAAAARNRRFYQRLGFETVAKRRIDDRDLVLLGRTKKE